MKKRKVISLALVCILTIVVLVAPVSGGLTITDGDAITTADGTTSPVIAISGAEILDGGIITINVSALNTYIASAPLTDANVVISSDSATWAGVVDVDGTILTLTSTVDTLDSENIYVTFTGPWVADSGGYWNLPLPVTWIDTGETATIDFIIETVPPPPAGGLTITQGDVITTTDGTTSPVITITGADILYGYTITIDLPDVNTYVATAPLTNANVEISSDSGTWDRVVDADGTLLTLTSTGDTPAGENIYIKFTGATNPWVADSGGYRSLPLTVTRTDTYETATLYFRIETPVKGGLIVTNGEKIISRTGATSAVITITDAPIAKDGTIVIDVLKLNGNVANGRFTNANVVINDNAVNATWTGIVTGNEFYGTYLTLTSTEGPTGIGETVNVTFTGAAGSAWLGDTKGTEWNVTYTATRTDTQKTCDFNIVMETSLGPGGLTIAPGTKITTTEGATTAVITITEAAIGQYDTILIPVGNLNGIVANGTFTTANVVVDDTAVSATWTGVVAYDGLTLTSNGGATAVNETVTVTFTGPWIPNTGGNRTIILTAYRIDNYGAYDYRSYDFNFMIDITPPPGYALDVDFSATPTSGITPLSVSFTDKSKGHPTEWSWDFGNGEMSTDQNPGHIYTQPGLYSVTLTVWNKYSMGLVSKTNYINVINGAIVETDTEFSGLTITHCGYPQTIAVNTSILAAELSAGNSVLAIQAPPESGFKNITFFSSTRAGFTQNGDLITGHPTRVHLESVEIAPASGFSDSIGTMSSFWYSIDLPSYPCKAKLSTTIWEGAVPEYDTKLQNITAGNTPPAVSIGTAYTAEITKINFPAGATAKIHMSVNSSWNDDVLTGGPGTVFIWRIADDGKSGQILRTNYLRTDPVTNLDYYVAESNGFSTFGISSLTGNNNPFQMVAFVAAQAVNSAGSGSGSSSTTESQRAIDIPENSQNAPVQEDSATPEPTIIVSSKSPIATEIGMVGWLIAFIIDNPVTLVIMVAAFAAVAYFGWWKRRL